MHGTGTLPQSELFDRAQIEQVFAQANINFEQLNIEELWRLIDAIETKLGVRYLRMDFGVPGLPTPEVAVRAQVSALTNDGVAAKYPPYDGVPELKEAVSRFLAKFLDLDIPPECCIPTCGSTHASFIVQAVAGRRDPLRNSLLFIDPGYPPMKAQAKFLGLQVQTVELYEQRGPKLLYAIEAALRRNSISAICWSSPNNPSWSILTEEELQGIALLCQKYDLIAIEDATYLGMDFRFSFNHQLNNGYNKRHSPPTIAKYFNNYFLLLSASKMFSYAGERVGLIVASPSLLAAKFDGLTDTFGTPLVQRAINKSVFNITAGVPHSAQIGVAALFNAITEGTYDLSLRLQEYGAKAKAVKEIFQRHGFYLIYDDDFNEPIQDGFYFTFGHTSSKDGVKLLKELLYCGLTALPLDIFGSLRRDGLRACVALLSWKDLPMLEERLENFQVNR